jgi:hypothetical protein
MREIVLSRCDRQENPKFSSDLVCRNMISIDKARFGTKPLTEVGGHKDSYFDSLPRNLAWYYCDNWFCQVHSWFAERKRLSV